MSIVTMALLAAMADPTTPEPAKINPLDKVECRRLEVTGSRAMTQKLCMTKREWNRGGDRTRDELGNAISRMPGPDR